MSVLSKYNNNCHYSLSPNVAGLNDQWHYCRGDLYIADLGCDNGGITGSHVQSGIRPVVVMQNDIGNIYAPTLIVVPITSRTWKKPEQPTHHLIQQTQGLYSDGLALAEQITTIDKRQCIKFIGQLRKTDMDAIQDAAMVAIGSRGDCSSA